MKTISQPWQRHPEEYITVFHRFHNYATAFYRLVTAFHRFDRFFTDSLPPFYRLSPAFPFNLLNYAYGLTSVSLRDYFFASWIGMLPATAVYVFLGSTGLKVADLGMEDREPSSGELVLYGVGIMAAVVVTVFITRTARRALQERVDMEPDADTTPES